ncbi:MULTISPECIES: hypothetical protein [Pseudomonas]|jgi:hypothetical protein|nr:MULTISPECIES: hypothetical protein [Pseudomonas]MBS5841089.1 hypothetical protein [Pseudomonas sp.]NNA10064.1 hypothetical protein [Pseudomonas lundensis]NNA18304.1 hypothetical protein [Pseudomonas lundensis]
MMNPLRADFLMTHRAIAAGATLKWPDKPPTDASDAAATKVLPTQAGIQVTLSAAAMEISALLRRTSVTDPGATAQFGCLTQDLHQQLSMHGKEASALQELPEERTPQRVIMSMQASNYLLTSLYDKEKLHDNVATTNPFKGMDRLSLSHIAFEGGQAFTAIERQVAFMTLTDRDLEFRNQTFDLSDPLNPGDENALWGILASYLRDAQMASGMSESERAWRGWMPADALHAQARSILDRHGQKTVDFPAYSNLKGASDTVLVAMIDQDGISGWVNVPVEMLKPQGLSLRLIEAATKQKNRTF